MKEKIRCAILGVGRLGYVYAENLATRIKGAELVTMYHDIKTRTLKGSVYDNIPSFLTKFKDFFQYELAHFIECLQKK